MRILNALSPLFLAAALLPATCSQAQSGGYSELRVIYVNNSREENGDGYHPVVKSYIRDAVQQLVADNTTNMLFYLRSGETPQYTRTQEKVMGLLQKLDDRPGPHPDILTEKQQLRSALYKGRLDLITRISIDLFVTDLTLRTELSGNRSGYLLNFFPRELQFMSRCAPGNITVRVHYPPNTAAADLAALRQQTGFCDACPGVAQPIRYEFSPMKP